MKKRLVGLIACVAMASAPCASVFAQQGESVYGDAVKADVKMNYVYSMEEALKLARQNGKPVFFNCFADWAVPCHAMNKAVFSDRKFCDFMDKNFVNLFMEMTSAAAKPVAEMYGVKSFAHFLVLDKNGDVLLRIIGGKRLPEFQECLELALNPKTTLPGAKAIYESGKAKKKDLLNYARVLKLAGDHELYRKIGKEYVAKLSEKEYFKPENWEVFTSQIDSRDSALYRFLADNKEKFEQKIGAEKVNKFLDGRFMREVYPYALGNKNYDTALLSVYRDMNSVNLPDSSFSYLLYSVSKMRSERKLSELFDCLKANAEKLDRLKYEIDMSLEFSDLADEERTALSNYLSESAQSLPDHLKRRMEAFAKQVLAKPENGVAFEMLKFDEALAKAKAEGKLVFMDCYTTWCGPCKMLDKEVFPLPEVGAKLAEHFICIKKDMEKGEGPELTKRFKVDAFPTMLILDGEGNELHRILGFRDKERLFKELETALSKR